MAAAEVSACKKKRKEGEDRQRGKQRPDFVLISFSLLVFISIKFVYNKIYLFPLVVILSVLSKPYNFYGNIHIVRYVKSFFDEYISICAKMYEESNTYLFLSEGGIIRPCDFRM